MSASRSPSPTHNLAPSLNRSASTNLRQRPLEEHVQAAAPEYTEPITVQLSPQPSLAPQVPESSTRRRQLVRPAEERREEEPMAKRIRRLSPEARGRPASHSSPSSEDSQDDMADNEMDMRKADRPETLPSASAPPKKKRTRTLTTPHQSAVLHALLAQACLGSRFPTTAMREEVGRSIGLSARKVQIWFQNQRQKSRRPRSQSDTPTRPPQYGPFPSGGDALSHGMHGYDDHGLARMPYSSRSGPSDISPTLLGPGMPGAAPPYTQQTDAYRHAGQPLPALSQYHRHPHPGSRPLHRALSPPPYSSPRMYSHPGARPATSQSTSWRDLADPSRTLPPLVSTRSPSANYPARPAHYASAYRAPFPPPRSPSHSPMFAHHPPEPAPRPAGLHLPPPFTLEPAPQWDEAAYSAVPRPSSSAWSRPGSTSSRRSARGRSASPVASRREIAAHHAAGLHPPPSSSPLASTPPSRPGRYDPVRATFVAFPTPTAASPAHSEGAGAGGGSTSTDAPPPPQPQPLLQPAGPRVSPPHRSAAGDAH